MYAKRLYEQFTGSYSKKRSEDLAQQIQPRQSIPTKVIMPMEKQAKNVMRSNTISMVNTNVVQSPQKVGSLASLRPGEETDCQVGFKLKTRNHPDSKDTEEIMKNKQEDTIDFDAYNPKNLYSDSKAQINVSQRRDKGVSYGSINRTDAMRSSHSFLNRERSGIVTSQPKTETVKTSTVQSPKQQIFQIPNFSNLNLSNLKQSLTPEQL